MAKRNRGTGDKLGVVIDFSAMKAADWLTRLVWGTLSASSPDLAERFTQAVQTYRQEAELILVAAMQVIGNVVFPYLPGKLSEPLEDVAAKIPTSVSTILKEHIGTLPTTDRKISVDDLPKLRREMISKVKALFNSQVGTPNNLIDLMVRGHADQRDYLEIFVRYLRQIDGPARETFNQLLIHGELDQLINLLSVPFSEVSAYAEAISLLHPKGPATAAREAVSKFRQSTVTDDTLQQLEEMWNSFLTEQGCEPMHVAVGHTSQSPQKIVTTIIVTPDQFTDREKRLLERN